MRLSLFCLALLLAACSASAGAEQATPTPLPAPALPTFTVQQSSLAQEVSLTGRIRPVLVREAAFEIKGKIGLVYVLPGDPVHKGQLLAELESYPSLLAELAAARQAAQAAADAEQQELRRVEIALEIARLGLTLAQKAQLPEQVRIGELQVELAQMDLATVQQRIADRLRSDDVQRLEAELAQSRLLAGMDGVLLDEIRPGAEVRPGSPVASIGDPAQVELAAAPNISTEIASLREGMPVSLWLEQTPARVLSGVIRQLPTPYGSGKTEDVFAPVSITIDQPAAQAGYTLGDTFQVRVTVADLPDAVWLPPAALRSVGGVTFVFMQGPTGPKRVNVTTGIFNRTQVQILEGLVPGQVVIAP